ncbi:hypothetical protein EYR38_006331 [Pleurotus pulmonarius]|nr:hypothetical protein EYR38_006331 [Pleurotus pulmonarius]
MADISMVRRRSTRLASIQSTAAASMALSKADTEIPVSQEGAEWSDSSLSPMDEDSDVVVEPTKTKRRAKSQGKKRKGSQLKPDEGAEDGSEEATTSPRKKKRAPKPEPVYVIPDVEKRMTTFKGRLGYACLNTILRNKKPATDAVFCSRTCRLDTIKEKGIDFVKDLGVKNVEDLLTIIEWNEANNIRFMRISSDMFPFASHSVHGYSLDYCAPLLARVGELASKYNHRLTTHPGQYTQLGSPKKEVIAAAVRELKYHCEMLDLMGIDQDGVMIVHGGGVYGDKEAALERIKDTIANVLPQNVRDRLVLENDEICYSASDLLPICEALLVPLVFDYHHDALNPSLPRTEIISRANEIFRKRGIKPKQHLSEAREGAETLMEKRKHSARCNVLPEDLPDDMDLMIEAKDKEQAVMQLYRTYDLHPVIYGVELVSIAFDDSKQVAEAKESRKLKRSSKKAVEDDDGDGVLQDVDMSGESPTENNGDCVLVANEPEEVTTQVIQDVGLASFDQAPATKRSPVRRSSSKVAKRGRIRKGEANLSMASPGPQTWAQIRKKVASLPFDEIPKELGFLRPYGSSDRLWCCWSVEADKTFNFFANPHPDQPDVFDNSSCSHLTVADLPEVLETALLLPPDLAEKMAVVEVLNSEGNPEHAFAVGSNYKGIMPVGVIELISRFFFDGRNPTWALDAPRPDSETISSFFEEQHNGIQVVDTDRKLSWQMDMDWRAFEELLKVQ